MSNIISLRLQLRAIKHEIHRREKFYKHSPGSLEQYQIAVMQAVLQSLRHLRDLEPNYMPDIPEQRSWLMEQRQARKHGSPDSSSAQENPG
jgi:hypothetical protein